MPEPSMIKGQAIVSESDLIPNAVSALPPGPWLIFAPHADDETLGMGGTLLLGRQHGIATSLVIMTDGARGGEAQGPALAAVRKREAEAAGAALDVQHLQFWRQPDGRLTVTRALIQRVAEEVAACRPATVFFPSPMELHPDHRAAATIVWEGLKQARYPGNAWAYEIAVQAPATALIDITAVAAAKRDVMSLYASQLQQNIYVQAAESLNILRAYTLGPHVACAEAFFAFPPGCPGTLAAHMARRLRPYWQSPGAAGLPLVSVIVRTRDRPHLLQEALQSVALQTYPCIELVVVNDGGKDAGELVRGFAPLLSGVCYVDLPQNRGRAAAANAGLDAATGDYIIFLDDDDLFEPDHLSGLVEALRTNPDVRAAYCGTRMEEPGSVRNWDLPYDPTRLQTFGLFAIHAALFGRELVAQGCRFDETLPVHEDWDFWLQVAERTGFVHVSQVSAVYRAYGDSGNGAFDLDRQATQAARAALMAKWAQRWSRDDLAAQVELARSLYLGLQREHLAAAAELRQMAEALDRLTQERARLALEIQRLKLSTTYRAGRLLTAPWRWLGRR